LLFIIGRQADLAASAVAQNLSERHESRWCHGGTSQHELDTLDFFWG
jgi:hypothetical protein